jgi:hypothetical protein
LYFSLYFRIHESPRTVYNDVEDRISSAYLDRLTQRQSSDRPAKMIVGKPDTPL